LYRREAVTKLDFYLHRPNGLGFTNAWRWNAWFRHINFC